MAIKYRALNPKYIELYSSKPPHIAPSKLTAIMPAIRPRDPSKVENTMPEKKTGLVNTTVASRRPRGVEGKPPLPAMSHPTPRLASSSR